MLKHFNSALYVSCSESFVGPVVWLCIIRQTGVGFPADFLTLGKLGCKGSLTPEADCLHPIPLSFLIADAAAPQPRMGRFVDD